MSPPEIDIPEPMEMRDHFARRIAVVIALATLLAASVGYLQHQAASAGSEAALAAQRHGIRAVERRIAGEQEAYHRLAAYAQAVQQQTNLANLRQQLFYAQGDEAERLRTAEDDWTLLAARSLELSEIGPDNPDGPDRDPTFPNRFLVRATRDAIRLEALQDAANELASSWSGRSASYTAILAILAVALYLLGFSLTVGQRQAKRLFAVVGSGLVAFGAIWSTIGVLDPLGEASPEAAEYYADGVIALETAFDQAGNEEAYQLLSRAIELRPTFARAYLQRADAAFRAGSPQTSGFLSISSPDALRKGTADLQRALELGLGDVRLYADLAFQRFLLGLQENNDRLLEESASNTRRALAHNDSDPVLHFNLAVALLGLGRVEDAGTAYGEAIRRTIYSDVTRGVRRSNPYAEEAYVAGALTDLGILGSFRPSLMSEIGALKEQIVGSVGRGDRASASSTARIDRLTADVFPSLVQWRGDLTGFDTEAQALSVQWYRRDPIGLGWAVLPEVSALDSDPTVNINPQEGTHFGLARYLGATAPARCLPEGTYRVELYSDGRLIGTEEVEANFAGFEAFAARDVGAAFCRPAGWLPDPSRQLGLVAGFQAPDMVHGAYILHLQTPQPATPEELSVLAIESTMLGFSSLLPEPAVYEANFGTDSIYFMGLSGARWRWYSYTGGAVRIGAGADPAGGVWVGLVFGPSDWYDGTEWQRIVESFTTYE